jgi:hypothetical protein
LFQTTVDHHPDSWNAQDSLGEALAGKGDKPGAIAAYTKAQALVKDPTQKKRIDATLARLKARSPAGRLCSPHVGPTRAGTGGGREVLRWRAVPGSHAVALARAMI